MIVEDDSGATDVEWIVAAPPSIRSVALPKMPDHLNIPPPPDADELTVAYEIADVPTTDAKAVREQPLRALFDVIDARVATRGRVAAGLLDVPAVTP